MWVALAIVAASCGADAVPSGPTSTSTATLIPGAQSGSTEPGSPAASAVVTSTAVVDVPACADVVDAVVTGSGGVFTVAATVRSGDLGWEKYADAWEVRAPDGTVLAERALAHPHQNEQPFTRSLGGVAIPSDISEVVVAARDSVNGFCGATLTVAVER